MKQIPDELLDQLLEGYDKPGDRLGQEACRSPCWNAPWRRQRPTSWAMPGTRRPGAAAAARPV